MGIKVAKFGGSSVADGIQLKKLKDIIQADPDRKYVIVSAPGKRYSGDSKITDLLYMCQTQRQHNIPYDQLFQVITDRYSAVKYNLNIDVDLDSRFEEIKGNLEKGCSEDYIVSRGEYLSAILVAAYLDFDFVDTQPLIFFDKRGRLMAEETNAALAEELAKHERAVIPGFYGSSKETGEVKVFSRGGSDVTGSVVARAVQADMYENWTDVSGLLMADPRIVKDPEPISRISYVELRELSYMGASVLHEDAVFPARKAGIPINIRNTNEPEDPGTIITTEAEEDQQKIISGVAGNKDFTVIAIYKNMMNKEVGFLRRVLTVLEDMDINFEHVPTGIDTISVVISNDELDGKLEDVVDALERQLNPDDITVHENISLIAAVGTGMNRRLGTAAKMFSALAEAGVNIRMIDQGSSEINIIVGVDTEDFEKAIRAIYNAFVA
ncbi:aspartate kinase [Eubacterium pyruvativorans]|uniref:Aspartokinase n=1 Tax=Eubacterium pyruvativorans TaxID=155865 RepID=A0A1I7FSQ4_9FIRM|nr:aspartate kinase [Eubacterium pyruvativorans]HAT82177.1 aspartate kinase [Eubacterium sp.]MCI5746607.1 aspartate kinase [Eubacterium pyruvativorans]MDD6707106.1 aspartate kinase [Eubacterium pyruvativorans]MDD7683943.1 aspartate kinase [Eubacterium pyruvativorans]MDY4049590.1 aspartate kinase [Eubacterium pyruvativorans]